TSPDVGDAKASPAAQEAAIERQIAPMPKVLKDDLRKHAPKAQRRQKATDAMSAALARQQALNKPKGI
ncbi:hypothetical protein, partial [Klebsiella pneumoniae]|uniref:hypothetical protein n=1 Tax=Klebsiella pneumoniae TaxID=573 RepID=UPI0030136F7D